MIRSRLFHWDKSLSSITNSAGTISLFPLATSLILEVLLNTLPGTINTMVLSAYSETAVAAVGAANQVLTLFNLFFNSIVLGTMVVLSNCIGAEAVEEGRKISFSALFTCGVISAVILPLLYIFSKPLLILMNLTGTLLEQALLYFRIRVFFLAVTGATSVLLTILKCYGHPKFTVFVGLTANLLNLLFTAVVVFFPQYSPVQGVAGIAYAFGFAQIAGLALAACIFCRMQLKWRIPDSVRALFGYGSRILKIGFPTALSGTMCLFSGTVNTAIMASIGEYALTANVYFSNILSYAYLFSNGLGNANSILVGRLYGAGEHERANRANRQLIKLTVPINVVFSLLLFLFRYQLVRIFTNDPLIVSLSFGVFAVDLLAEQARAISQIYEYALRATGDVMFSAITFGISVWVLSIGLGYVLAIPCKLGLLGCWIGVAVDEIFRAVVSLLRWKSGAWKKRKFNEITA